MTRTRWLAMAWGLLAAHVAALLFGVAGMLIALPNPQLWANSPLLVEAFKVGMTYGGMGQMLLGAAAVFAFGVATVGPRKTAVFFVCACAVSLGAELLGTMTGVPFGAYSYMGGLGEKVLDHVPFTIPLSWFYMGFAGVLLGRALVATLGLRPVAPWTIALGVWLLTAWDLVLDPAMAHESLKLKFWVWHESGPYFGMPVKNFAGWALTGALFMSLSRWLWREDLPAGAAPPAFPLVLYVVNTLFAVAISLSIGIWPPVAAALLFGVAPAVVAWRPALLGGAGPHASRTTPRRAGGG